MSPARLRCCRRYTSSTRQHLHHYNPQREFPRDRYTREFKNAADWPVCSVAFEISGPVRRELEALLPDRTPPKEAICTRYYDGSLTIEFHPEITDKPVEPGPVLQALKTFAATARRLTAPATEQETQKQTTRTELVRWACGWQELIKPHTDLRKATAITLLSHLREESDARANPETANMVEALQSAIDPILTEARKEPATDQAWL
jgi:hypothetical protein